MENGSVWCHVLLANRWKNYNRLKDSSNETSPQLQPATIKRNPYAVKWKSPSRSHEKNGYSNEKSNIGGKGHWSKVSACSKFISIAKSQSNCRSH